MNSTGILAHAGLCFILFFITSTELVIITIQNHEINSLSYDSNFIRNFLSHIASLVADDAATYSTSMVELTIHDCLILLLLTAAPPNVKTYPEVDFLKSAYD